MYVKVHNCWKQMPTEKVHFRPATSLLISDWPLFYLNSDRYVKGLCRLKAPETYEVYVNNENKQPPTEGFPVTGTSSLRNRYQIFSRKR